MFNGVWRKCIVVVWLSFLSNPNWAQTEVKLFTQKSKTYPRSNYNFTVLKAALEASKPKYGAYRLTHIQKVLPRDRLMSEVFSGTQINIVGSALKDDWVGRLHRIPIPINRGISGYKVFLLPEAKKTRLQHVRTVEDLRQFSVGGLSQWHTIKIFKNHQFSVVNASQYRSLFPMLLKDRFEILSRNLNEVFFELDYFSEQFSGLALDQSIVVYMHTPNYFVISPEHKAVQERVYFGLKEILNNGVLDKIFVEIFGSIIQRGKISERRILFLKNPFANDALLKADKPYILKFPQDFKTIEQHVGETVL